MVPEKKPYKEVTLYNFATLRNAEYTNLENLKNDPSFIIFYPEEFSIQHSKCDYKEIELGDFDPTKFLDFDLIRQQKPNTICETLQFKTNKLFDKIYHFEKNSIDDFYHINNLLLEFDRILEELHPKIKDLNPADKVEKRKLLEKEFVLKVWYSYVANIRLTNNFKQKEIGHNLLKFYHLRKHRNIIDDEKHLDKKVNFKKIFNARIIIPEELFPKSDTLFYGGNIKEKPPVRVSSYFAAKHRVNILEVRKEKIILLKDEENNQIAIDSIENEIKILNEVIKREKEIFSIQKLDYLPYIVTLEKIMSDFVLLIDFDERYFNAEEYKIKVVKCLFPGENNDIKLKDIISTQYQKFDICLDLGNHFDQYISKDSPETIKDIIVDVTFENGHKYRLKFDLNRADFVLGKMLKFNAEGSIDIAETDEYGEAFPPSGHGVKMLGIADYRKVVSTISRYVPAEVAHIENVMASEFREKVTTKEISTEITDFTSIESETEKQNETTTNDRFQMQNEVSKIINEQRNNNLTASAGYSGGGYFANITTGNSTVNSKQLSDKQAVENAKEITTKAVEKIVSRVKTERTVKTSEKFIDVNKYGFDNKGNREHVSGVYRHINAVYRNQVHNYGKRLAYEFSVPEPALLYLITRQQNDELQKKISEIEKPIDLFKEIKTFHDLTQLNYIKYIQNYKINENEYPVHPENIVETIELNTLNNKENSFFKNHYNISTLTFDGNFIQSAQIGISEYNPWFIPTGTTFNILVEENNVYSNSNPFQEIKHQGNTISNYNPGINIPTKALAFENKSIIKLKLITDVIDFKLFVSLKYIPTEKLINDWKNEIHGILKETYQIKLTEYQNTLSNIISKYINQETAKSGSFNRNKQALIKRKIEIETLKRNCQSFLVIENNDENKNRVFGIDMFEEGFRSTFTIIKIKKSKELDEYTAFVRFIEQAFEWENMSYSFYPYFWGANNDKNWLTHYLQNDDDLLHQSFLQAGMARVIVTVRPGFEEAVNLYMVTGKIWNGGSMPVYGSSLFVSIDKELNNNLESVVEDEWETVLPTNLIALQSSGVAIQQMGLPDLLHQGNLGVLEPNEAKLPTGKRKKFLGLY